MTVAGPGEGNAVLLAASVIFQGRRSVADLSLLLANVAEDIRTDGRLDDAGLGTALISDVRDLDLVTVRTNLERFFADAAPGTTVPAFERYVRQFIERTEFVATSSFDYPAQGLYGENILRDSESDDPLRLVPGTIYSAAAVAQENNSLRVRIVQHPDNSGNLSYRLGSETGWRIDQSDEFSLLAERFGTPLDIELHFDFSGRAQIEYYENTDTVPSRTQAIVWGEPRRMPSLEIPARGAYGPNLLALARDGVSRVAPGTYSMAVTFARSDNDRTTSVAINLLTGHSDNYSFGETGSWDIPGPLFPPNGPGPHFIPLEATNREAPFERVTYDLELKLAAVSDSMTIQFLDGTTEMRTATFGPVVMRWGE